MAIPSNITITAAPDSVPVVKSFRGRDYRDVILEDFANLKTGVMAMTCVDRDFSAHVLYKLGQFVADEGLKHGINLERLLNGSNAYREFGLPGVRRPKPPLIKESDVKRVIFDKNATVILWADGTKTVVKCQEGDAYSPEAGVAIAIMKKILGNKGNFNEVLKRLVNGAKRSK